MPRAAIISWDHKTGRIALLSTLAVDVEGEQPEGLEVGRVASLQTGSAHVFIEPTPEGMAKLSRFLQRIAPIMPDGSYREPAGLPEPTAEEWAKAQRFSSARAAKGVRAPRRHLSDEQILNLIDALDPEQEGTSEQ
jgi:hypothetical protein